MAKISAANSALRIWLCGLTGLVLFTWQARAQYDPQWTRNFRVGAIGGLNIKADFKMSGQFSIAGSGLRPAGANADDQFFDDGYVRVDETGNAQGQTSYWGYESAAQHPEDSQTLLMHRSSSFTASGSGAGDESVFVGAELAYGGSIRQWGRLRLGWELGVGLLPIGISADQSMNALVNRTTYTFDTGDIVLPTAPYHGGSSGIGATIQFQSTGPGLGDSVPATITGQQSLDLMLYTVRLGPSLFWDWSPHVGLSVSAGPAVGITSGNYTFNETIVFADGTTARNRGGFGAGDVVFGGYVNAVLTYHVEENGDLYLGVQYMPMGSSTTSSTAGGGRREARLDLAGQIYLTAGFNWPF